MQQELQDLEQQFQRLTDDRKRIDMENQRNIDSSQNTVTQLRQDVDALKTKNADKKAANLGLNVELEKEKNNLANKKAERAHL